MVHGDKEFLEEVTEEEGVSDGLGINDGEGCPTAKLMWVQFERS